MFENKKMEIKMNFRYVLIAVMVIGFVILAVEVTPAAAFSDADLLIHCTAAGGTFSGSQATAKCSNATSPSILSSQCPGGSSYDINAKFHPSVGYYFGASTIVCYYGGSSSGPVNYGMERKGLCKLVSIDDASLGGNLTAIIKGKPSVLKLKADGKTYELPVVPGSVVANGDGTYTAQFYTMDPVTGQALVPAGDYTARCHGENGSNDGGSANTVTIGY